MGAFVLRVLLLSWALVVGIKGLGTETGILYGSRVISTLLSLL